MRDVVAHKPNHEPRGEITARPLSDHGAIGGEAVLPPTEIVYELLPVTLLRGQIVLIQRASDADTVVWYARHRAGAHPTSDVLGEVQSFFGSSLDTSRAVIHSTSWRYVAAMGAAARLILTYLIVVPEADWLRSWMAAGRISVRPLAGLRQARGSNIRPPETIRFEHVVAHALDHLAMLVQTDGAVRGALSAPWQSLLRPRQPQPAGCPRDWTR